MTPTTLTYRISAAFVRQLSRWLAWGSVFAAGALPARAADASPEIDPAIANSLTPSDLQDPESTTLAPNLLPFPGFGWPGFFPALSAPLTIANSPQSLSSFTNTLKDLNDPGAPNNPAPTKTTAARSLSSLAVLDATPPTTTFSQNSQLGAPSAAVTLSGGAVLELAQTSPGANFVHVQLGNPVAPGVVRPITLTGTGGTISVPASATGRAALAITGINALTGDAGTTLTKTGIGELLIAEPQNFAGDLVIAGSGEHVELRGRGALLNVASITIGEAGGLVLDSQNNLTSRQWTIASSDNRVNDAAPITLLGGHVVQRTLRGAASDTLGAVTVGPGQAGIELSTAGGFLASLNLTNLTRSANGGVLDITASVGGTLGGLLKLTGNINGTAPAATLAAGWLTLNGTHFLGYGANGLVQAVYTDQGAGNFTPTPTGITNLNATGTATLNTGAQTLAALRFSGSAAQTLAFDSATQQLSVTSGGVLSDNQNVARTLGATVDSGRLTAGDGSAATAQNLFLSANQNTLTINARLIDNPANAAATVRVVKALDGTVLLADGANSYTGGTAVYRGTLIAGAAGALGSGAVTAQGLSTLQLSAPGAVNGTAVPMSQAVFSAQDGAVIELTGSAAYTTANDRFSIAAGTTISALDTVAAQGLASLTRVTTFTGGGQVMLAPGAIVRARTVLSLTGLGGLGPSNLGTAADLYFSPAPGAGLTDAATFTIGPGTPWRGLSSSSAGAAWEAGMLIALGDFTLQGLYRDSSVATLTLGLANSAGTYSIANGTSQPVQALVSGQVALDEDSGVSMPSNLTFVVGNGALLQPNRSRSLGDPVARPGSGIASVLVQAGGTLDPGDFTPIGLAAGQGAGTTSSPAFPLPRESPLNGSVTIEAAGRLLLNDPAGLGSSSAVVTMRTNSVLELGSATAFSGRDSGYVNSGRFAFEPGVLVRLTAGNINHLQSVVLDHAPQAVLEITGANLSLTNQTNPYLVGDLDAPTVAPENLALGAGMMLVNDAVDRQLLEGRGKIILASGATLAATTEAYLNIQEGLEIQNGAVINIGTAQLVDGIQRLGGIQFLTPNGSILPGSDFTLNMAEGTQLAFNNVNVWPDAVGINLPNAVTTLVQPAFPLQPATGHSLLLSFDALEILGPLTGNGSVYSQAVNNTAGIGVGWAASIDFAFGGPFRLINGRAPVLEKYGPARMTLTGVSDSTNDLRVWQGELAIALGGATAFNNIRLGTNGTLTLDNTVTAANARLGGPIVSGTNSRRIIGQGGTLRLVGHSITPVNEVLGTLTSGSGTGGGRAFIEVATGAAQTRLTATALDKLDVTGSFRMTTWIVRTPAAANLPGTYASDGTYTPNPGNLTTGLFSALAPNLYSNTSFGMASSNITGSYGTPVVGVRPDFLGSATMSGLGSGFMTLDTVGPGGLTAFRLLAASEYASTIPQNATTNLNVRLTGTATVGGDTRLATLTLAGGSTLNISGTAPFNNSAPRVFLHTGGIFAEAGAPVTITGSSGAVLQSNAALPLYFQGPGDVTANVPLYTETNLVKSGDGNLTIGAGFGRYWRGTLVVDAGTLALGANNPFVLHRGLTGFVTQNVFLNGGTLDLGGNSEMIAEFASGNPLPYGAAVGGTLTSAAPATVSIGGNSTYSGRIMGAIALDKYSANTLILTNDSPATGALTVRGGVLYLRDEGRFVNASQIDLGYATLRLDNGGLAGFNNRVNPSAPVTSRGGAVQLDGRVGTVVSQNFATFAALEGRTDFNVSAGASGAAVITFGNLTRAAGSRATISFNQSFGFTGAAGNDTTAIRYLVPQLNGASITLANHLVGPWAVVNGDSFATYSSATGIGALGNTADGFAPFDSTDLTTAAPTHNVSDAANRTLTASQTVNSLRLASTAAQVITLGPGTTLTLASGGLIANSALPVTLGRDTSGAPQGSLTSGGPELYAWVSGAGTTTFNTVVAGAIALIKTGTGSLELRGNNTFNGPTEVQGGTLTLNTTGADGAGTVAIPGDLILRAGAVTESQPNQIKATASVTIQGAGALTLRGVPNVNETLASLNFLSDAGTLLGANPALTRNATTGAVLNLTGTNAITAVNNNVGLVPIVNDTIGTLNFTAGAAQIINVSGSYTGAPAGTMVLGLVINAAIGTVPTGIPGGGLVKTGNGMLALGGTTTPSTFGSPTARTEVFSIQQGAVRVDEPAKLGGPNAITTVQNGALLLLATGLAAGREVTGSVQLKTGATLGLTDAPNLNATAGGVLGVATASDTAQSLLTVSGNATILLAEYFNRDVRPLDLQVRGRLTGSGNLNLVGAAYFSGLGAGSTFQLGNPIQPGSPGANDYSGTITVNVNTVLTSQHERLAGETSTLGGTLGAAAITLNGGRLRLRDDFSLNNSNNTNQTATYGNAVTLAADSFLDANRTVGGATNNTIILGTLTVNSGTQALTVDSTNNYRVGFSQLDGPGTLVKSGQGLLGFVAIAPGYSGNVVVAGPRGLNVGASGGLQFSSPAALANFTVDGAHTLPDGSTLTITSALNIGSNAGQVANGTGGLTTGSLPGALALGDGAAVNAGLVRNQGFIGSYAGAATLTASSGLRGTGFYIAAGAPLTLNGTVMDDGATPTILRVAGSDVVTLTGPATTHTGGTEIQAGTLRVAPAGPSINPLGTAPIRTFGFPLSGGLAPAGSAPAPGGTLQFDGPSITHTGGITNQGTVRISGGTTTIAGTVAGTAVTYAPGLLEGRLTTGDFSATRPANSGDFGLRAEPRMAQTSLTSGDPITGWSAGETWVYTGEVYDADGKFSFAENLDDAVLVVIDGVTVLANGTFNQVASTAYSVGQSGTTANMAGANGSVGGATATPMLDFGPGNNGWHTLEIRLRNNSGTGGATEGNGFFRNFGLGFNAAGATGLDGTLYSRPIADLTANPNLAADFQRALFRTAVGGRGNIVVDDAATLNLGAFSSAGKVVLSSNSGTTTLRILNPGTHDADTVQLDDPAPADANLATGVLDLPAGATVTATNLVVAQGTFTKRGAGTLSIGGAGSTQKLNGEVHVEAGLLALGGAAASDGFFPAVGPVIVEGGELNLTGSVSGSVIVNSGRFTGSSASPTTGLVGSLATIAGGRIEAGGSAPGLLRFAQGLEFAGGEFGLTFNGAAPGTGYDQLDVTGGVTVSGDTPLLLTLGYNPADNVDQFIIVNNEDLGSFVTGGGAFTYGGLELGEGDTFLVPGAFPQNFSISYIGGDGNDVVLTAITTVPEPGPAALLLGGLALLMRRQARSRQKWLTRPSA